MLSLNATGVKRIPPFSRILSEPIWNFSLTYGVWRQSSTRPTQLAFPKFFLSYSFVWRIMLLCGAGFSWPR
jgi:hypothetical protein